MKKYTTKKGFLTIDLVAAIAVFSILATAVISIIVSYERNTIISNKKQEMNFYIECIGKEVKYSIKDSDIVKLKNSYINKSDIENDAIEKEKLLDVIEDKIDDYNFYIQIKMSEGKNLYIKYVNNKAGVNYVDEEKIKIT